MTEEMRARHPGFTHDDDVVRIIERGDGALELRRDRRRHAERADFLRGTNAPPRLVRALRSTREHAPRWYANETVTIPFSRDAVEKASRHSATLTPGKAK